MVINGKKYIQLFDFYTSKNQNNFPMDSDLYKYTFCISNCVMTSIENRISQEDIFYSYGFFIGKASENFILYDKKNKKVLTQSDLQTIFIDRTDFSYNVTINLENLTNFLKQYELLINNKTNGTSQFVISMVDSSIVNLYSYTDLQFSTVFDNIYACRQLFPTFNKGGANLNKAVWCDLIGTGVDLYDTNTDCKIANSLFIKNSMLNGSIIPRIDNTIFAIDWTVYIDGTYNPTIKIKWDSNYFDVEETGNLIDTTRLLINFGGNAESIPLNWASGSYTTNYEEMLKLVDLEWYQKYFEGLSSLFDAPLIFSSMIGGVKNGSSIVTSGQCFFNLTPKGTVTSSGSMDKGRKDTVTIIYGNDSGSGGSGGDSDSPNPNENDEPISENEPSSNTLSLLTTSYAMTPNRIKQLGSFLWGSSFIDNIRLINNSPIENIVSCKMFPFNVASGTDVEIVLGNVSSGVNGQKIGSSNYSFRKVINGFTVSPLFNNFLDYEPYTKISVYLPFIGIKTLQPSQILGKVISLEYIVDIVTGVCKCIVKSGGKQISDYDGSCGIDIPITSSNRAQVELAYITSALGVVGSVAMGSPLGVVGSVLNGASSSFNSQSQGTSSPCTSIYGSLTPFLIFDRPKYSLPSSYGHTKGYVCNSHRNIGSLSGFTICHENIDLTGIGATQEELEEIKSILTTGFFV